MADREMTLASGMVISYLDVGAADGEVMLYFHGTPSSRMQAAGPVEAAAARLGVRVIAPDRPGCGDSSFVRYRVADYPAIVARFADSLGIGEFGVIIGPALIAVYAITTGAAAIAGEEDRGVLEVTLSAPVSRIRVFTERCAGLVIGITILMIATGAALWIFSALLGMGLGVGAIASGAAALGLFGLFTGAVAIAVGAATGSAAAARGLAAPAAVASYLINALAQITSVMRPARPVSPYYLVLGNEPLAHGLRLIGAVSVLAAVAVLLVAGGIRFARRDLS